MRGLFVSIVLLLVALAGCAQPAVDESAEITGRSEAWLVALNSGDIDSLLAMYTDDVRLLAPNAPMQQGKEAVAAAFGGMIDAGLGGTIDTVEAVALGDLGIHIGTFEMTAPDGTVVDQGKFIETWRKIDGDWKITADMFGSSLPVPGSRGVTIVVTHEVEDGAHWLAAWQGENSRRKMFAPHGVAYARTFQSPDDPNHTSVVLDITDMEAFEAVLASEEGALAMEEDGLKPETMRMFLETR